jgi:hypothetical protein
MEWHIACAGDSELAGGSTPKASHVRKNHVGGVPRRAGDFGIRNELYRIHAPGILGDAGVREVRVLVVVQDYFFQNGTEAQRLENLRFALRCEVDCFCLAAAFDVEDAIVAPAMLVILDEMTLLVLQTFGNLFQWARLGARESSRKLGMQQLFSILLQCFQEGPIVLYVWEVDI